MTTGMPNVKMYQQDPYRTETQANCLAVEVREGKKWVQLDQTVFYPTGGGQSADTGLINGNPVSDVIVDNDIVWHCVEGVTPGPVETKIDWDNRYRNMQQHTGQHILSAVLYNRAGLETVSVHLGTNETLVEILADSVDAETLTVVETEANRLIRENVAVEALLLTFAELDKFPVRREVKTKTEPVRLIRIGEYDITGCGGTHVRSTGEVGLIKITATEKIRGRVRIHALIGSRAYEYFALLHQEANAASNLLSAGPAQLRERVADILNSQKETERALRLMTSRWIVQFVAGSRDNFIVLDGQFDMETARNLSQEFVAMRNVPVCVLLASEKGTNFIVRLPDGLSVSTRQFLASTAETLNLRGGGPEGFIQGVAEERGPEFEARFREEFISFFGGREN